MRELLAMLAVLAAGGVAMAATLEWGDLSYGWPVLLVCVLATAGALCLVTREPH